MGISAVPATPTASALQNVRPLSVPGSTIHFTKADIKNWSVTARGNRRQSIDYTFSPTGNSSDWKLTPHEWLGQ